MASTGRRAPIFGPEPWTEHAGAVWSHWDRWYCVMCVDDFGGDWGALADRLAERSGRLHSRPDAEAKLSHLDDLVARLAAAELAADELAVLEPVDTKVRSRARDKVLDRGPGRTRPERGDARHPAPSVASSCPARPVAAVPSRPRCTVRAAGGHRRSRRPHRQARVVRRDAGARRGDHRPRTLRGRRPAGLAGEYRSVRLDWHAGQAEVAIAWLHVATRHLDGFASVAARLGSEHWMPIVGLAERAVASGRPEFARTVFEAADQPGWHRDHLRRQRTRLLDEATADLRVVSDDG